MIGTEIKHNGKEQDIRQYCKNIPAYDLSNADFDSCTYWYLLECFAGESHIARQKCKARMNGGMTYVSICNMDILSEITTKDPYHSIYVVLVGTV